MLPTLRKRLKTISDGNKGLQDILRSMQEGTEILSVESYNGKVHNTKITLLIDNGSNYPKQERYVERVHFYNRVALNKAIPANAVYPKTTVEDAIEVLNLQYGCDFTLDDIDLVSGSIVAKPTSLGYYSEVEAIEPETITAVYNSFCQTMTVTGDVGLVIETKDSNGNVIGNGVIGSEGTVTYPLNGTGQVNNVPIYTKSAHSNTVSHSLVILSEIQFTTTAGEVGYTGTEGDQILLSNGTIVDIPATSQTYSFNVPAGTHKVKLVESVDRDDSVIISGEALVELHNFPTLSTVTHFSFYIGESPSSDNLTKVPNCLPSNITDISYMFAGANSFNQDISGWNVSNVTNMSGMFEGANSFNQPLNDWDVSNVTDMYKMFYYAISFNQNLSMWCVSKIPSTPYEFDYNADNWTLPKPVWGTCPKP